MTILKIVKSPYTSLVVNFLYAVGNCFVGFYAHSWWFITAGAYYSILAITRFSVLQVKRKANGKYNTEIFAKQITGILLVLMSFCIIGVNVLSALNERGTVFHKIIMIAIATYTFTKITISIIGMVKANASLPQSYKHSETYRLQMHWFLFFHCSGPCLCLFPG